MLEPKTETQMKWNNLLTRSENNNFVLSTPWDLIHAQFREGVPEIFLDNDRFCLYSLFITFVDVCDRSFELELKYHPSKAYFLISRNFSVGKSKIRQSKDQSIVFVLPRLRTKTIFS